MSEKMFWAWNLKHVSFIHSNFEAPIHSRIQDDGPSNFVIVERINRSDDEKPRWERFFQQHY